MVTFRKPKFRDYEMGHTVMTLAEVLSSVEADPLSQCPICMMTGSFSEIQRHMQRGHIRLAA